MDDLKHVLRPVMECKKQYARQKGGVNWVAVLAILLCIAFWWMILATLAHAETYSVEKIADAIYKAEGGPRAKKPYGILSVPCHSEKECREICLTTIENNFSRYQIYGHKTHSDFISFLSSRYAPVNCENDNGTNKFWVHNVKYFLAKQEARK
jgi:hypothetical protein